MIAQEHPDYCNRLHWCCSYCYCCSLRIFTWIYSLIFPAHHICHTPIHRCRYRFRIHLSRCHTHVACLASILLRRFPRLRRNSSQYHHADFQADHLHSEVLTIMKTKVISLDWCSSSYYCWYCCNFWLLRIAIISVIMTAKAAAIAVQVQAASCSLI